MPRLTALLTVKTPGFEPEPDRFEERGRARVRGNWIRLLRAVAGTFERLVSQLAGDNFLERNVGQRHPRRRLYQRSMSQAKLTHSLGNNIDQKLLIRDHLSCFTKKLSRHMAQGTNGVPRLRDRELKNDRRAVCKGGRDKVRGEHGKMSGDFPSEAPLCQRISFVIAQITFEQSAMRGLFSGDSKQIICFASSRSSASSLPSAPKYAK